MHDDVSRSAGRTRPGVLALFGGGIALVLLGVGLVASERFTPLAPTEYGWFAYASVSGSSEPTFVVATFRDLWALAAAALGLAFLAAGGGYVLGARRSER